MDFELKFDEFELLPLSGTDNDFSIGGFGAGLFSFGLLFSRLLFSFSFSEEIGGGGGMGEVCLTRLA